MIQGVKVTDLKIIEDERGSVKHMLKSTDPHFRAFGEVYFSHVVTNVVKAWHLHKKMWLNYACIFGQVVVGLVDLRKESPTCGRQELYFLDAEIDYRLLTIPPMVWNGFRIPEGSIYDESVVANCATLPHDPSEIERIHPRDFPEPFDWGRYEIAG